MLVVVPAFLALGWWQLDRALSGNALSWAYVFEWPIFGGYAVFMWWKLVHEGSEQPRRQPRWRGARDSFRRAEEDEAMAAYNQYLAALHASDSREP